MRRREFLTQTTATVAALPFAASLSRLFAADGGAKKILYFSRSQGFEHSPVKLGEDGESVSDKTLKRIGKELGIEVVCTKDGSVFDGDLDRFDAFVFYTSGDLDKEGGDGANPMSADGVKKFFEAIRSGKGFLGFHSSTDTWRKGTGYKVDAFADQTEYIRMQGGEFIIHGEQQEATITIVDDVLPWSKDKKPSFRHWDEWYANKNFAPEMRVLMTLETAEMKKTDHNKCYDRPAFPCLWARKEGKGTSMYCAFGHCDEFWTEGKFDGLLADLLRASVGEIEISTEPNLKRSCPGADVLQNDWNLEEKK